MADSGDSKMSYQHIVVLTGAGISAESGTGTYRDKGGLWEKHRIEDVATPEAFQRDPAGVLEFYNLRRRQLLEGIEPNDAHRALARLEQEYPGEVLVVTQNVDDLHERAGSHNLIHMHGELLKARCTHTQRVVPAEGDINPDDPCPCCNRPGRLRPHVVWFGEMPMEMERIENALASCDLFLAVGTSGNVYPAAGFVQMARAAGAHTVELNLEPSETNMHFHEHHQGPAGEQLPRFVDRLLEGRA